jgi:hypothetical protein
MNTNPTPHHATTRNDTAMRTPPAHTTNPTTHTPHPPHPNPHQGRGPVPHPERREPITRLGLAAIVYALGVF